ncbi:hypothetical protein [Thalassospira aquimaris]|uniref:Uncharacterized protein n=1 Tax=Thalassospira aquimaris TaxID=3037796 RepID=A0ABT6GHS9_9PROT|nr:hypothetical protein [Thalassospira sp. FZY0004]MDG4721184.1 hypothetical protein [Thalassospira sp. FZY0004]
MSNLYSDLDYMAVTDEQKRVTDAQREFAVMMMEFKNRWARTMGPETVEILTRAADDAEHEFLGTMIDDAEGSLKARLSEIKEEGDDEDIKADHLTENHARWMHQQV